MHRSIRFLVNIFLAVLSFLMLGGSISNAVTIPEQRTLAKRNPTSTNDNVYQARQYRPAEDFRRKPHGGDCPPYPLPSGRCSQTCRPNEVAKRDGSCICPEKKGFSYDRNGYCGLERGETCTSNSECQSRNCRIYGYTIRGKPEKKCGKEQQGE